MPRLAPENEDGLMRHGGRMVFTPELRVVGNRAPLVMDLAGALAAILRQSRSPLRNPP